MKQWIKRVFPCLLSEVETENILKEKMKTKDAEFKRTVSEFKAQVTKQEAQIESLGVMLFERRKYVKELKLSIEKIGDKGGN